MRIVHMTSVHVWNDNRIFNKMCRSLVRQGHEVHLVAVMDSNVNGKETHGVIRHAVNKPHNRRERFLKTTPTVLKKAQLLEGDLYHFHDPEFLPYMTRFRARVKKPVVYDVHEDYPATILSKDWIPGLCRFAVSKGADLLERKYAMNMDAIIVAWPKILERFPGHPRKILINNYPYRDELQSAEGALQKRQPGFCVYVGGLTPLRGIVEMIRAAAMGGKDYKLVLGGTWSSEAYKRKCQAEPGWAFCEYRGFLSRTDMRALYAEAQAGVIAFFPEPNHLYSVPNKIFEYMSAGLPVIASDLPVQKSIVEETNCGVVADAQSPASIFEKMKWMRENPEEAKAMGKRGLRAVEQTYNWDEELVKLTNFYKEVLAH
ncbi:MAG: glycosyltransferase family 4 protein [Syntrophaceae bacterium]|nr:glycosyltransferase family 4 protein [Syntrophaceae bacterium]